ncbi:putative PurR-regulated permease PerM [Frigoribacterium sp. PvP120]|uniref:AI-2E family transporter n=1 Tax=unclassified Frigoribacterium TaxID=2627005 RepID=UPI001623A504|nr:MULTISPECIES: AI-2E family transporter [unclassified Frigoribacterium]MBD8660458.1 AI-2E family transporter [Frigoribacterium sp. CFBP 8754]MBD8726807.1 AI-2E family transporter [Frigoribacterium sp. CFBP 13707]MBP1239773.1 putative PurR-regulated permease PerM [Frigoribacterium sp. PvP121]QNE43497.1 AI-2E family transporter [Frigoribacterium sp. NBH87]
MGLFRTKDAEVVEHNAAVQSSIWTDAFGRLAIRSLQIIAVVVVGIAVIYTFLSLSLVTLPVLLALIFASAMYPLIAFLRRHRVPSLLATIIALLGVVVVLGLVGWLLVWAVENQASTLAKSATEGFNQLQDWITTLPFSITDDQIESVRNTVVDFVTSAQFGSGALAGASAIGSFATGLVLMIVVLFFFLKDGPAIWEFLLRPFKGEQYARARRIGDKTVATLGGYVRGTATVAAVDAIGIGIGLAIIGVPLALPLAVVVFLTAFIPLVGATAAGILAALVALVANGPVAAIWVIAVVVLVNQLEGNFLQPVLMGRTLQLHGLVILVALTAGTILGGVVGAVIAVPLMAVVWGITQVWNGEHQPAEMFRKKRPEEVR